MSTPLNPVSPPAVGVTVYWQQAPVVFHGVIAGTDCCAINDNDKICLVVPISAISLDNS